MAPAPQFIGQSNGQNDWPISQRQQAMARTESRERLQAIPVVSRRTKWTENALPPFACKEQLGRVLRLFHSEILLVHSEILLEHIRGPLALWFRCNSIRVGLG